WAQTADADWRSWSMARSNAHQAISTHEATLRAWACARPVETTTTNDTSSIVAPATSEQAPTTTNTTVHDTNSPQPAANSTTMPMLNHAPMSAPHDKQQVNAKHDVQRRDVRW
ncbi:MAG TPA: hypothetical protein VE821_06720, partial [Pyrinomonadaceae bacterium]|nr:hypothetical protein [Pyrinomonadaceae bacterium]